MIDPSFKFGIYLHNCCCKMRSKMDVLHHANQFIRLVQIQTHRLIDCSAAVKHLLGLTGVWAIMPDEQESKIAAIGIKLRSQLSH